ncbi:MAG: PilZ domain-containing protein [Spirochaetales bacterium]|nr:PilZ domain-containing protein [Spirochaetales bacterium]
MRDKREYKRKTFLIKTIVKKVLPNGDTSIMEFVSTNLSEGGIFILSEDLSIFDLGEEFDIIVDYNKKRYYEGKVRLVRSARNFSKANELKKSGYGLMFLAHPSALAPSSAPGKTTLMNNDERE